jgi:hypothetical protein
MGNVLQQGELWRPAGLRASFQDISPNGFAKKKEPTFNIEHRTINIESVRWRLGS